MKTRLGFVSNSSSSSFIIGVKPGTKLTVNKLMELFKIPTDSPVYNLNKEIAEKFIQCAEHVTIEDMLDDYGYDSVEDAKASRYKSGRDLADVAECKMEIYRGYASDEDGGVEAMVCNMTLNINTDDLLILKDGGY